MKKLLTFLMILALVSTTLVACGSNETAAPKTDGDQAKKVDYPTKPINVIVSYAAGGGTDVGARILLPFVEKELGVTMNVINKAGNTAFLTVNLIALLPLEKLYFSFDNSGLNY